MKRKEFATEEGSANNSRIPLKDRSDIGIIASHVFGAESPKTILAVDPLTKESTDRTILENTRVWVHKVLDAIDPALRVNEADHRPGRLGLPQVRFDSTAQVGTLIMSSDRLSAQAQSNFSSVKANVCFYSGKWQYEIQLESKGVMQLGWAMREADFSTDTGVGDNIHSFAYDGNRLRKWNLVTSEYGEAWQVGDIIGCTLDLDGGNIHFYRNGRDMGEAFSSLVVGPGCVYYPAVSLAFEEKILANFGALPIKYPVDGYEPLQQPPVAAVLRTNQLLHWMFRSSTIPKQKPPGKVTIISDPTKRIESPEAAALMICEILMKPLSEMLGRPYIVEACLVPFLQDITAVTVDKKSLPARRSLDKLNFICDTFYLFYEPDDFGDLINCVCKCLLQKCNQTAVSLEYSKQKSSLVLLTDLAHNCNVRTALLRLPGFTKTRLPEFMELKVIDVTVLKQLVPVAWWPLGDGLSGKHQIDYEGRMQKYLASCQTIKNKTVELEQMQESLLETLLNNSDSTASEPSSRKYFLHMFRMFLKDNHLSSLVSFFLNNQNVEPTPLPVALSYFNRLVNILKKLWERECPNVPAYVPIAKFYDGSIDYFTLDRLGGVLSHLIHTFQTPLASELGNNHRMLTSPPPPPSANVQIQVRGMDGNSGAMLAMTRWANLSLSYPPQSEPASVEVVPPEPLAVHTSLVELLDGVLLLYNLSAHRQLHKVSTLRDDMDKYIKSLNEAKLRLRLAKKTNPESVKEIEASIQVFEQKLEEQSRVVMVWMRGRVYTAENRSSLVWLLRVVLATLERASQQGDLFAFVPEFYVETMVELCVAIRSYFSPTLPLEEFYDHRKIMIQVAEFLVKHFADPRVVNLGSKDTIVEALAGFISKKPTLECLENISPQSQQRLVSLLLQPYDNRPWGQSNWIMMRMWQGCGFAYRYTKSPHLSRKLGPRTPGADSNLLIQQTFEPCPSQQYQQLIAQMLKQDDHMAAAFLNSVLKQLNWSFSEFISMIQEIQNLSKRPERVIIDARQLKICATCFDFVINLLRVLEMVCTNCPMVFTDQTRENTENLLERLTQLLSQILLRITSPTGCFNHVISLDVPDLDSIDQFPILSAVVGVLLALLADDLDKEGSVMSVATRCLLSEPAFQIDTLKDLLEDKKTSDERKDTLSFRNYPEIVSAAELEKLTKLITVLTRFKNRMSVVSEVDDEDLLCPICCALPLTVTFNPCTHQSCKSCITHHLMNSKECFFCKATILRVMSVDGSLIFEAPSSSDSTSHTSLNH